MRRDPFSDPGDDGEEPDGSLLPPEAGQQGLFLCLPAGELDADRFAQSGPSPDLAPGPLLATIVDTITGDGGEGLAGLSDDQLIGVIAAVRRMESRAAWYLMAAVREFAVRRSAGQKGPDEFAADELAHELHLTWASAAGQMEYACAVADRLPATFAALAAGTIHPLLTGQSLDRLPVTLARVNREPDQRCAGAARRVALTRAGQIPLLVSHA
jgi:hypothetical protein